MLCLKLFQVYEGTSRENFQTLLKACISKGVKAWESSKLSLSANTPQKALLHEHPDTPASIRQPHAGLQPGSSRSQLAARAPGRGRAAPAPGAPRPRQLCFLRTKPPGAERRRRGPRHVSHPRTPRSGPGLPPSFPCFPFKTPFKKRGKINK